MPAIRELILVLVAPILLVAVSVSAAPAQDQAFLRGLSLEGEERFRDAADSYRQALRTNPSSVPAVLGLERVYAALGWTDSILPVLERAIASAPRVSAIRAAQIRSLRAIGQHDRGREAFERWLRDAPRDPAPYREYARMLLQDHHTAAADTVLQRAQAALGRQDELQIELAQLRAAMGLWVLSASSWRRAVIAVPHYEQAAVFSLAGTPPESRDSVRIALRVTPVPLPALRLSSSLELLWGHPEEGWRLLANLRPDSAVLSAWSDFATRAEEAQAWRPARDALLAVARAQPSREVMMRAASAALAGGDAASAADISRRILSDGEAGAARDALPMLVRALGTLGRAEEAQRLYTAHQAELFEEQREEITRQLAWAWVRAGDTERARALLGRSSAPAEVEGWLALYEGDFATARRRLTRDAQPSPQLLVALGVLTRTSADRAPTAGGAFLAVARGDSLVAAEHFERAARELPEAGSLLLLHAASLRRARAPTRSIELWRRIAEEHPASPEAPEALLEWARTLGRGGDASGAVERLEHLILTYPRSALLPQARRELEQARASLRESTR